MGWLVAIVVALLLIQTRRELVALRRRRGEEGDDRTAGMAAGTAQTRPGLRVSRDLVILRLQLLRMRDAGALAEEPCNEIVGKIDGYWADGDPHAPPGSTAWWLSCEAGWDALAAGGLMPRAPPPWRGQDPAATPPPRGSVPTSRRSDTTDHIPSAPTVAEAAQAAQEAEAARAAQEAEAARAVQEAEAARAAQEAEAARAAQEAEAARAAQEAMQRDDDLAALLGTTAGPPPGIAPAQPAAPRREAGPAGVSRAAPAPKPSPLRAGAARIAAARTRIWRPVPLDALGRALRAAAGWPRLLVPFLLQGIGWFIGGFLFLAGSVFLVAYTSGFLQAAVVFASLYAYTVFLIWAGHKLLRTHLRLATASSVLLATGMLLVPLSIAAATRLLLSAGDSVWFWIVGALAAVLCIGTFYLAAQVVSGVIHRSLRGAYPRLFIAMAALQLAAVVVAEWPSWPLLGALHLLLLGLLAYGLLRFAHEWLHSIFVDRKKIAFFAAGSLLYATLASFVHLTWGIDSAPLPPGYYAPYLMIVCGLLFYLDAQFKLHVHRAAFLSRFSFLVYGLTVAAVVLAIDAPVARPITLALAAALYAMVLWKYLTLIPLYLMLASGCGLYADILLAGLTPEAHLLLALPGLYGLSALSRWAVGRSAQRPSTNPHGLARVALVTYRASLLLLTLLAAWSLYHGDPGWLAAGTGLVFAAALAWLLRAAPGPILTAPKPTAESGRPVNLLRGPWLYAPIAALTASVAFAPLIYSLRAPQFSILLAVLACLWTALLLYRRGRGGDGEATQVEVYANSTLLSLAASVALAAALAALQTKLSLLLVGVLWLNAVMLLALSLNLYVRWLFYAFLLAAAAVAVVTKLTYFPQPSVGLNEMLGVGALWVLLWWLDRQPDELSEIARRRAWRDAPARLLWWLPAAAGAADASAAAPGVSNREGPHV